MAKGHVGTMPTNPTISEHKEMHIPNSYRDTIRAHCMQRRNQGQICKDKNYHRLETSSKSKIGQGIARTHGILQKIY